MYPWLSHIWQRFERLYSQQKMPHAILLTGPFGNGQAFFARQMACQLLAHTFEQRIFFDSSDGHPDLIWLKPEGKLEIIKIDAIREAIEFLSKTSQQGGYRVIVIEPAERLNRSASNALLKCLEEPGEKTLLILISSQPQQLLPTLRSRCQQWELNSSPQERLNWLLQQGIPKNTAQDAIQEFKEGPLALLEAIQNNQLSLKKQFKQNILKSPALSGLQNLENIPIVSLIDWLLEMVFEQLKTQSHNAQHTKNLLEGWDRILVLKGYLEAQIPANPDLLKERLLIDAYHLFQG